MKRYHPAMNSQSASSHHRCFAGLCALITILAPMGIFCAVVLPGASVNASATPESTAPVCHMDSSQITCPPASQQPTPTTSGQ